LKTGSPPQPSKQFRQYIGEVKALCRMPVGMDSLSFDEIRENGVPEDVR